MVTEQLPRPTKKYAKINFVQHRKPGHQGQASLEWLSQYRLRAFLEYWSIGVLAKMKARI